MNYGKFAIVGAGAVGGYFAAVLARAGFWIGIVARGEHLRAIQESGLQVRSVDEDFVVKVAMVTDAAAEIGPVDAVIVAVKTWQVQEAAHLMKPLLGPQTKVLPLQNGVEASGQLQEILGQQHVLIGLCHIISRLDSPGHIHHVGVKPTIFMGESDDSELSPTSHALADALIASGVVVHTPPRIQHAIWEKLLFLAPLSGVSAVARATVGEIRRCEPTRRLIEQSMREVVSVANATGVSIGDEAVSRSRVLMESLPEHATVSMQRDIVAGRPSEVEAIIGAVIRLGREGGVPTPAMDCIYAALLPQEQRARNATGGAV